MRRKKNKTNGEMHTYAYIYKNKYVLIILHAN